EEIRTAMVCLDDILPTGNRKSKLVHHVRVLGRDVSQADHSRSDLFVQGLDGNDHAIVPVHPIRLQSRRIYSRGNNVVVPLVVWPLVKGLKNATTSAHVQFTPCRAFFRVRYVETVAAIPTTSSASSRSGTRPSRRCLPTSEAYPMSGAPFLT